MKASGKASGEALRRKTSGNEKRALTVTHAARALVLWTSDHNQARFVSASARASAPDEHRGLGFSRQPSCSRSFGSRSDIVRYPEGKARAEGKDDAIREGKERSLVFLEVKED